MSNSRWLNDMTWSQKLVAVESHNPKISLIGKKIVILTSLCWLAHKFLQLVQTLLVAPVAQCLLTLPSPPPPPLLLPRPLRASHSHNSRACVYENSSPVGRFFAICFWRVETVSMIAFHSGCRDNPVFIFDFCQSGKDLTSPGCVCVYNCAYKKSSPGFVGHYTVYYTPHRPGHARPKMRSNLWIQKWKVQAKLLHKTGWVWHPTKEINSFLMIIIVNVNNL